MRKDDESVVFFSAGVDPKSVLCAFFKQGQCTKGDKCKFSHDLSMERKCEKRSVYVDERDEDLEKGWHTSANLYILKCCLLLSDVNMISLRESNVCHRRVFSKLKRQPSANRVNSFGN